MKYFIFPTILILTACSLDKNSTYWNEDKIIKSTQIKKSSKNFDINADFKNMTFDEFNLFLKDYSDSTDYPDIDD